MHAMICNLTAGLEGAGVAPGLAAAVVAAGVSLGTALDTPCKGILTLA